MLIRGMMIGTIGFGVFVKIPMEMDHPSDRWILSVGSLKWRKPDQVDH